MAENAKPETQPIGVTHAQSAGHHARPLDLGGIDPAAEESLLQVDVDQLRNLMRDTDRALKQQRKAGLEAGRLGTRIKTKCEELRTVRFVPLMEKNRISVPRLNGYMRSAHGLDLAEQREPGADHSDRSRPDLAYYADALAWPAKGRRYSCETPQLRDMDAVPAFLPDQVHVGPRFSLPVHTQTLLQVVPDLPHTVWDCCCGDGAMAEPIRATGRAVIASDIIRYRTETGDYYPHARPWDFRCERKPDWLTPEVGVVANLPWMSVDEWGPRRVLKHFCAFGPAMICLFLPSSMTGCLVPPRLLEGYALRDWIIFEKALSHSRHPVSRRTYPEAWECAFLVYCPGEQQGVNLLYVEDEAKAERRRSRD